MISDSLDSFVITNNTLLKQLLTKVKYSELSSYPISTAENIYEVEDSRVLYGTIDNNIKSYSNLLINEQFNYLNGDFVLNGGIKYYDNSALSTLPLSVNTVSSEEENIPNITYIDDKLTYLTQRNDTDWYINDKNLIISSINGSYYAPEHSYINYIFNHDYIDVRNTYYCYTNNSELSSTLSSEKYFDKYAKIIPIINDYKIFEPSNNNLNLFGASVRFKDNSDENWSSWLAINLNSYLFPMKFEE